MFRHLTTRSFLKFPALLLGVFTLIAAQPGQAKAAKKESKTQLMIVCATSLSEDQEVVLASRDEKGAWLEHGPLKLRASLISDFLPARAGELHLALRGTDGLESICQFTYPEGAKRALAVLVADPEKKLYEAHVVDPEKLGFVKGSVLIFNLSPQTGVVSLGPTEEKVEAGQQRVAQPPLEGNGMYRMMVSYLDADGKAVMCYDRQTSGNANSRDMLFLLPEKTVGLRVLGLSIFKSLD